jgi:hypothetical protein
MIELPGEAVGSARAVEAASRTATKLHRMSMEAVAI